VYLQSVSIKAYPIRNRILIVAIAPKNVFTVLVS
jgi:hypothetical protein